MYMDDIVVYLQQPNLFMSILKKVPVQYSQISGYKVNEHMSVIMRFFCLMSRSNWLALAVRLDGVKSVKFLGIK